MRYCIPRTATVVLPLCVATLCGCPGINPDLVGQLGGSPVSAINVPDGNIVILVSNLTPTLVTVDVQVTKQNGGTIPLSIEVPGLSYSARAQDCDIQSLEITQATYGTARRPITLPPGPLSVAGGTGIGCGQVLSIIVVGTPPDLTVQTQVF